MAGRRPEARLADGGRRGSPPAVPLKRHRLGALLALAGLCLGWAIAAAVVFVWPPGGGATKADAVVVLAGGRGPRLQEGLALVRRGAAPVLVVSDAWSPTWPEANTLCAGRKTTPVRIVCFHPDPYDTRGEARGFTRLATQHGWHSVIVVTSPYHTVRAKMLFERCFDGRVATDASGEGIVTRVLAAPVETMKMGLALLVRRGC